MIDIADLLKRQARWQESMRDLPWPEKLHMAARLRASVRGLRRSGLAVVAAEGTARPRQRKDPDSGATPLAG